MKGRRETTWKLQIDKTRDITGFNRFGSRIKGRPFQFRKCPFFSGFRTNKNYTDEIAK